MEHTRVTLAYCVDAAIVPPTYAFEVQSVMLIIYLRNRTICSAVKTLQKVTVNCNLNLYDQHVPFNFV